jgi:hypothetical protein
MTDPAVIDVILMRDLSMLPRSLAISVAKAVSNVARAAAGANTTFTVRSTSCQYGQAQTQWLVRTGPGWNLANVSA